MSQFKFTIVRARSKYTDMLYRKISVLVMNITLIYKWLDCSASYNSAYGYTGRPLRLHRAALSATRPTLALIYAPPIPLTTREMYPLHWNYTGAESAYTAYTLHYVSNYFFLFVWRRGPGYLLSYSEKTCFYFRGNTSFKKLHIKQVWQSLKYD